MSAYPVTGRWASHRQLIPVGIIAFSLGVILLYRFTILPPPAGLFVAGLVLLPFVLAGRLFTRKVSTMLFAVILGLGWAAVHSERSLQQQLPVELERTPLQVSGYLCSLPTPGSFNSLRFDFCVSRWHDLGQAERPLPDRLRLSWYGRKGQNLPGHRLRLQVSLKRPHGNLNPEGFRYENWLFRQGIRATGSVKRVEEDNKVACGLRCRYHNWHRNMAEQAQRSFGTAQHYPLVASLLIGDRRYLNEEHWQVLRATGTIHLVAISGLHLGLVAVAIGLVARRVLLAGIASSVKAQTLRTLIFFSVLCGCTGYALLAGFTVPTRRALIMVSVGGWYLLRARQHSAWWPFSLALLAVLLLDPLAPLDQGFWLSFGAVALLLMVFAGRLRSPGWLASLFLAQLVAFFGLWPMLMLAGQDQPLAAMLANLLAIPWLTLIAMPLLFAGAVLVFAGVPAEPWVVQAYDGSLGLLWYWLGHVASLPLGSLQVTSLPLAFSVAALVLFGVRWPDWRWCGLLVAAAGLSVYSVSGGSADGENPLVATPEVRVLDVGQGLAVVALAGRKVMVYDTGPEVKGVYSAVESVLIPGLRAMGVNAIDLLVISHGDSDHAGGLEALAEAFPIGDIVSGEPELVSGRLNRPVKRCRQDVWLWPGLELSFWRTREQAQGNDASCVLNLRHRPSGAELLLTGDISTRVETEMILEPWPAAKLAGQRFVIAPHHGSKTSSSRAWIEWMRPDTVIYTAGYRHHFGHPHEDVTARYRVAGANAFNTACSGQITLKFTPRGLVMSEIWRTQPFWISADDQVRAQCKIL